MTWWMYALISAIAASATAILAKLGVAQVPSTWATAVRTTVVLVFAWGIVAATQAWPTSRVSRQSMMWLALSGLGTGVSWLAYFKALQMAPASKVAPLDKLSLGFTIVLAAVVLGEAISWKLALGVGLMIAGALLTVAA